MDSAWRKVEQEDLIFGHQRRQDIKTKIKLPQENTTFTINHAEH